MGAYPAYRGVETHGSAADSTRRRFSFLGAGSPGPALQFQMLGENSFAPRALRFSQQTIIDVALGGPREPGRPRRKVDWEAWRRGGPASGALKDGAMPLDPVRRP